MWRQLRTFLLLFVTWLAWSGHVDPLLLGLGVLSAFFATYLGSRLHVIDEEGFPFALTWRLVSFIPWVIWQIVVANVQVARIILSPTMGLHSQLVRVRASQRTEIGRVIHANTITITPGTVTLDVRDDILVVHALTDAHADADAAGVINERVRKLEGPV